MACFQAGLDKAAITVEGSSDFSHINDMFGNYFGLKMPFLDMVIIRCEDTVEGRGCVGGNSGKADEMGE